MAKNPKPPTNAMTEMTDGPAPDTEPAPVGEAAEVIAPRPATLAECNRMMQRHLTEAATARGAV